MANPFEISAAEHEQNMMQFTTLNPMGGKVTGQAARDILMKSGLPPTVLGQIWSLSDLDHDGLLDQREFSIAMKLTRNCLMGVPPPPHLPPSILNVPLSGSLPRAPPPIPSMPPMYHPSMPMGAPPPMPGAYALPGLAAQQGVQFPTYKTAPAGMMGMGGSPVKAPPIPGRPPQLPGKQLENWTMPQQNKLKYAQHFNQIDKQRTGFLSGPAARNAMGQSGLPTPALAHVWTLSDVNKDGRLSVEEFSIAMWLIEQHKNGFTLPSELPSELASLCHHTPIRSDSPATPSGEEPAQKSPAPKTFEDKRRDNYDRGQAELDRRRQIIQEEDDRRRAEERKKEQEAEMRRERERQEIERKREAARQAEFERQRAIEEERLEQERKRAEERERIRQEQEKQRKKNSLEKRKRDLLSQKAAAAERAATQEQKKKTLQFQLQALEEKASDLNGEVAKARDSIEAVTKEIEGMRVIRDDKLKQIADAQQENQQTAVQAEQLAHQLLQLQGANRDATARASELEDLVSRRAAASMRLDEMKRQVDATRERNRTQQENVVKKRGELDSGLRPSVERLRAEHAAGLARAEEKKRSLAMKLQGANSMANNHQHNHLDAAPPMYDAPPDLSQLNNSSVHSPTTSSFPPPSSSSIPTYDTPPVVPDNTLNGHHESSSNGPLPNGATGQSTVKYRGIYAFEARSEDELSFEPGDNILVFEGHAAEPGWLAGQIKDKVGWFPSAFAEPIAPVNPNVCSPMQTVPSNVTPSPSLEKILEEPNSSAVGSSLGQNHQTFNAAAGASSVADTVLCTCQAQFPWKARNAGDLSFGKGDQIEVLERTDMKWRGRKVADGTVGWFPKSYVRVVEEGAPKSGSNSRQHSVVSSGATPTSGTVPSSFPPSDSIHSIHSNHSSFSVHSVIQAPTHEEPPTHNGGEDVVALSTPHSSVGEWFVAMYDFEAHEPTDLALHVGDRILVTERNDDWWKGSCNGREGTFPANYVGPADGSHSVISPQSPSAVVKPRAKVIASFQAAGENQLTLKIGDEVTIRSKSDAGWWEGEIVEASGQTKVGWFPGDYVQLEAGSSSNVTSPVGQTFVAAFDYDASQADELSFKTGDSIVVTSQADSEWWNGFVSTIPSKHGLFPANYVHQSTPSTMPLYDEPPLIPTHASSFNPFSALPTLPESPSTSYSQMPDKLRRLIEELRSTEDRYHSDLVLVKRLFFSNLRKVLDKETFSSIYLNWSELIELSAFLKVRFGEETPGLVFATDIDRLSAFVRFCSRQTAALERLQSVIERSDVRKVYNACCQQPSSRGLSLSYFMLLPLGRITRYPLLVAKMMESAPEGSQLHTSLDVALQLLKALVSEVNLEIQETDNIQMLCWAQQHVRCTDLREPLEFTSATRNMGPRIFHHSGVLYKVRSGRLLIALLFNDILLLTTPISDLGDPLSFKLSKSSEINLSVYKTPLLLSKLAVERGGQDDESGIQLKHGDDIIHVRAVNRNARTLWLRQLEEAVDVAAIANAEVTRKGSVLVDAHPTGRLLVEIVGLQHTDTRANENALCIRVSFGRESQLFEVAANSDLQSLKLTTQFSFVSKNETLVVGVYKRRLFAPDLLLFDEGRISLPYLISESAAHRGPMVKPIPLTTAESIRASVVRRTKETLMVKFVVQMFEADM